MLAMRTPGGFVRLQSHRCVVGSYHLQIVPKGSEHESFSMERLNTTYLFGGNRLIGSVTHGTGLGVVVCTFRIEIDKVLGCVFSDTKIADSDSSLCVQLLPHSICSICILLLVIVVLITRAKL